MYLIKWRTKGSYIIRTGLSRYATREAAEQQIARWQAIFPSTEHYIYRKTDKPGHCRYYIDAN